MGRGQAEALSRWRPQHVTGTQLVSQSPHLQAASPRSHPLAWTCSPRDCHLESQTPPAQDGLKLPVSLTQPPGKAAGWTATRSRQNLPVT